jgi:hypothetical protein
MLGEYGQLIDDAPYLLEPLIDGVAEEEAGYKAQHRALEKKQVMRSHISRPPQWRPWRVWRPWRARL